MTRHLCIIEAGTGRTFTVTLRQTIGDWAGLWTPAYSFSIRKGGERYA